MFYAIPFDAFQQYLMLSFVTTNFVCTRGMNKKNHVTAITNVHGVLKAELPATR